jgi:hypothetical protein
MSVASEEEGRRANWKRGLTCVLVGVVVFVLVGVPVAVTLVNDAVARSVEAQLLEFQLPDGAELLDSMSQAGKLTGNGNGMQYLGALLIKSDDSAAELRQFYEEVEDESGLQITVTPAQDVRGFHGVDGFLADAGIEGTFVVEAWGDGPGWFFENFDLRGH